MEDTHTRSFVKGLSWRLIATIPTMALVFIFTRNLTITFGVGVIDTIAKLIFFYLHERMWIKIPWGKHTDSKESLPTPYYP